MVSKVLGSPIFFKDKVGGYEGNQNKNTAGVESE